METFNIVAKDEDKAEELVKIIEGKGFSRSGEPDFVVSFGGDGTFLRSEREYPGVPKLLVRDSMVCYKCADESFEEVLEHVKQGEHVVNEHFKIRAEVNGEELEAINDVVIRNKIPTRALRFRVKADGEEFNDVIIGDGIVVATPFGSTGYYYSVTGEDFNAGIGVAFNNPTEEIEPLRLPESSEVELEVVRGEAQVAADNSYDIYDISEGDKVVVKKSDGVARILSHSGQNI